MRNYTFFDEYGIQVHPGLKDIVARAMGRSGHDMLGEDPNLLASSSLLYRMATAQEFLAPLRAFRKRRLLANLNLDLMVPLGTAAFLTSEEVDLYRSRYSEISGIVHTLITHPVSYDASLDGASDQCSQNRLPITASALLPIEVMRRSLDDLGWEKTIVNFRGVFPMAHNQIAAVTKFTTEIDRLLGFHDGRYLMDNAAKWLIDV